MVNKKSELEESLKYILDSEVKKIKSSVEGYVKENKSKGISQMIGRRYGHIWQIMTIATFKYSDKFKLKDRVLYKDYVNKWVDNYTDNINNKCCIENSKKIINKFLEKNTGTDQQDLCDFTLIDNKTKYGIDTKFRFISNDSNTVREIAASAEHLKFMGYEPVLLFRKNREDSLNVPLKRFENAGWKLLCGNDAMEFIKENSGFDLGKWIDENIDIWSELNEHHDELINLRFGEENWKF